MTLRALGVLVLAACGCGRLLGADFDLPEDRKVVLGASCSDDVLSCTQDGIVAMCIDSEWRRAFECAEDEHCSNQPDAQCIANEIDCSKRKGQSICVGTTRVVCDDDGEIAETADCPGPCLGHGECRSVVDMALGGGFSCAVLSDQTIWCWGDNHAGQLGHDENFQSHAPTLPQEVPDISGVDQLVAGTEITCARKGGDVFCWGLDLVLGVVGSHPEPEQIPLPFDAVDLVAGGGSVCVRMELGETYCWGSNASGQLCWPDADGHPLDGQIIPAFENARNLYMGADDACVRSAEGSFGCCGVNEFTGGMDSGLAFNPVPTELTKIPPVVTASVGGGHVCLEAGGSVYCWGKNPHGQLCLGHTETVTTPTLAFLSDATTLRTSGEQTLALDPSGNLTCCGAACPLPGLPSATTTPFQVLSHVTAVFSSPVHECALLGGRPLCWGANIAGQVKPGLSTTVLLPTLAGW